MTFGATGGTHATVDVRRFYFGQQTILDHDGGPADFDGLLNLVQDRRLVATRDRWCWRSTSVAAHAVMESRPHTGKIVPTV